MQKLRYCNIREGPRARKDGLRDMPGSLYLSHLFSRDQCTVVGVKTALDDVGQGCPVFNPSLLLSDRKIGWGSTPSLQSQRIIWKETIKQDSHSFK